MSVQIFHGSIRSVFSLLFTHTVNIVFPTLGCVSLTDSASSLAKPTRSVYFTPEWSWFSNVPLRLLFPSKRAFGCEIFNTSIVAAIWELFDAQYLKRPRLICIIAAHNVNSSLHRLTFFYPPRPPFFAPYLPFSTVITSLFLLSLSSSLHPDAAEESKAEEDTPADAEATDSKDDWGKVQPKESRIKSMKNNTKQNSKKGCSLPSQWEGSPFLFVCHFLCGNYFLMLGEFPVWSFLAQANTMMKWWWCCW